MARRQSKNYLETEILILDEKANAKIAGVKRNLNDIGSTPFASKVEAGFGLIGDKSQETASRVRSHFSKGLGSMIAGAFAFGAIIAGFSAMIAKASEAEKATRKLSASATEAGKSYAELAESNAKFAREAGLSQNQASSITARIQQLATFAGNSNQREALQKGFLDLASAKGIGTSELDNLIGTILSGQDEGLNRLGLADPSKLQEIYAKSIGKTADQLTQFEKVQSAVNAVLDKAKVFAGANTERMNSLSGQLETTSARLEDLSTGLGSSIASTLEFRQAVSTLSDVLGALTTNVASVRAELSKGITPKDLAEREANSGLSQVLDFTKTALSAQPAGILYFYDLMTKGTEDANNNFLETLNGSSRRRQEEYERLFQGEKDLLDRQAKDAETQAKERAKKQAEDQAKAQAEALEKERKERLKALENSLRLKLADPKRSLTDLRRDLGSLESSGLESDALTKLTFDFTSRIEQAVEGGKKKVAELEKATLGLFESLLKTSGESNPFVSVYSEADKAIQSVRENTKGLTEDLRENLLALAEANSATALFETRLETALNVFDLRESAREFRDAGLRGSTVPRGFDDEFIKRAIGRSRSGLAFDSITAEQRQDLGERSLLRFGEGNLGLFGAIATERLQAEAGDVVGSGPLQERLQRQLKIIDSLGASTAETRSIADRRLIALSSSVDPASLTDSLREAFASAREREAVRLEKAESEALKAREQSIETQKEISNNLKRLVEIAERDGLAGVEALIKIQDETGSATVSKRAVATPDREDVRSTYFNEANR